MIPKVNLWYSSFYSNNIKLHIDSAEYGVITFYKQLAIEMFKGCSFGKIRSSLVNN